MMRKFLYLYELFRDGGFGNKFISDIQAWTQATDTQF